ncbi:hypothetical protein PHMEG_0009482 [Phytophthora megakarya]|uniref:Tc1-like transposase DDE domain-containing protein n=1 Tax=Phytophthora megakarya TaxID=4795 RepID=A0A225WGE9_9STRA|nr:hypothetical protein PHMEG_0009482 [Phytophthora megakarya]
MIDSMNEYGIPIPDNATKHEVVFMPPYHSDLQPIELVWAIVKGDWATKTKFSDIRPRLEKAFENLKSDTVQGCIDAANKQLMKLKKHLETMDLCEEESSSSDDEYTGEEVEAD